MKTTTISRLALMRHLLGMARPFWRWVVLSTLLGALTIGASIGLMAASAWIIARAALQPSIATLQVAIVGVRFFGIARGVFRYLERLVSHNTTFKLLARIRVWFYAALEPLAPARLMQYRSGDLLSRIMADVNTLEDFYVRVLAPPLVAVLIAALTAVFLGSFAPVLALVVLGFMAALGLGVPLLTRRMGREPGREVVAVRAALNAAVVDGLQGMADIVAYGAQDAHRRRVSALSAELAARQGRMAWIDGLQAGLGVLIVSGAAVAVLAAAIPVVAGINLAALALATIAAFEAISPLPGTFQHLEQHLAAAERLTAIVVDGTPGSRAPAGEPPHPQGYDLVVEGLTFAYPAMPDQVAAGGDAVDAVPTPAYALRDITFAVRQGERVGVVGPSGAGKSTLVNLLLRFWDYDAGQIRLGGHDLRAYHADDVRAMIGMVAQQTHLFNTSLRENLLIARPDASEAQIIEAARQAQIHTFITGLPDGYDTVVGEQGYALSGGERQRVAIARALLKDAPILILDEATANLDAVTEQAVLQALETLARDRTTLIITHRLAGLERADRVLVLDGGRIVDSGTHHALVAREGLYRRLWLLQGDLLAAAGTL